jgi:hypothetical protein
MATGMRPSIAFKKMPALEQLKWAQRQVAELETKAAETWLIANELPADQLSVSRLTWGRYLVVTLRVTEFPV